MNLHAWAEQRAKYSRAKHGRNERGAALVECALIAAMAQVKGVHNARYAAASAASLTALAAQAAPTVTRPEAA
jgi:hypothetical protein